MLGGIQPGPLESYLREVFGGRGDDGLLQRFQLVVWPDVGGRRYDITSGGDLREAMDRRATYEQSLVDGGQHERP